MALDIIIYQNFTRVKAVCDNDRTRGIIGNWSQGNWLQFVMNNTLEHKHREDANDEDRKIQEYKYYDIVPQPDIDSTETPQSQHCDIFNCHESAHQLIGCDDICPTACPIRVDVTTVEVMEEVDKRCNDVKEKMHRVAPVKRFLLLDDPESNDAQMDANNHKHPPGEGSCKQTQSQGPGSQKKDPKITSEVMELEKSEELRLITSLSLIQLTFSLRQS